MYDPHLLHSCHAVFRLAQQLRGRGFLGRRVDLRLAGGTEATDTRDYTTGDDYRYVDWNRCMRHDELLSKQFHGTEQQHVTLLLDVSESMLLGNGAKLAAARRLAAVLGYLALRRGDTVRLAEFAAGLTRLSRDMVGMNRLPELGSRLDGVAAQSGLGDLFRGADQLTRRAGRRGLVVLLSDLFDHRGFELGLDLLSRRGYEPFVLLVWGADDFAPPAAGPVRLIERETGRGLASRLTERDRAAYREAAHRYLENVRRFCARRGFGVGVARGGESAETTVLRILRAASLSPVRMGMG